MLLIAAVVAAYILSSVVASKRLGRLADRPVDIASVRWVASGAFYALLLPLLPLVVGLLILQDWQLSTASGLLLPVVAMLGHAAVWRALPRTAEEPVESAVSAAARALFGTLFAVQAFATVWCGLVVAGLPVLHWGEAFPVLGLLYRGLVQGMGPVLVLAVGGYALLCVALGGFLIPSVRRVGGRLQTIPAREAWFRLWNGRPLPEVSPVPVSVPSEGPERAAAVRRAQQQRSYNA